MRTSTSMRLTGRTPCAPIDKREKSRVRARLNVYVRTGPGHSYPPSPELNSVSGRPRPAGVCRLPLWARETPSGSRYRPCFRALSSGKRRSGRNKRCSPALLATNTPQLACLHILAERASEQTGMLDARSTHRCAASLNFTLRVRASGGTASDAHDQWRVPKLSRAGDAGRQIEMRRTTRSRICCVGHVHRQPRF
ncbi:hypothetical protein GY45DRAFT_944648 [Cubamyces sp. BRFM 1775]|nr:hypothetical protein GY45DRAFT_944648 [Cubamyces sp. BRFM 1775]